MLESIHSNGEVYDCCSVSASGGVVVTVNIFPYIPALQREAAVPSATPTVPPSALGRCESNVAKSAEGGTASYPAVCRAHSQCERMDGCCVASCWLRWRVPSAAAILVAADGSCRWRCIWWLQMVAAWQLQMARCRYTLPYEKQRKS